MEDPLSSPSNSPLLPEEILVFGKVVDLVVPPDDLGTKCNLEIVDFLLAGLGENGYFPKDLPRYKLFLSHLANQGFATLDSEGQENILGEINGELETDFKYIVEQIQEGFYTSPAGFELIGWKVTG